MSRPCPRPLALSLLLVLSVVLAASAAACGGGDVDPSAWDRDPIVPGYSLAEVDIGAPFSAVQEMHGEPERKARDGGYHYAYYARTREGGSIDDPASWRLVVTLYDNGNGFLDPEDEVASIEVSSPYRGLTAGGVGLGSTAGEVEAEFGESPSVTATQGPDGEELQLHSYLQRGVDFLLRGEEGVITVVVTPCGGLRAVEEDGDSGARGGLFGAFEAAPLLPGEAAAGIEVGEEFHAVRKIYGDPDSTGFTTEGLVYATYTGGYGSWKLNLYLEDVDGGSSLDDFDVVVSIAVRHPYAGRTPKGVGISSPGAEAVKEFGPPERQSDVMHQGEALTIMEYNTKGIVFAARSGSGEIVEIDVNRPLAP